MWRSGAGARTRVKKGHVLSLLGSYRLPEAGMQTTLHHRSPSGPETRAPGLLLPGSLSQSSEEES